MGGGKSKSSTSSSQQTLSNASSGVVTGDLVQGQTITINQEFSENIATAFGQLVDLAGQSLELAGSAGELAIEKISQVQTEVKQPEVSNLKNIVPIFLIGIVVFGAVLIFKKG